MPIGHEFTPRQAQPDRPVGIDLGNALTRGLVFLWNGATPHYAVGNPGSPGAKIPAAQFVGTPLAKSIGPNGATPAFAGAGGYKWTWSLPSSPAECTFFAWTASNTSSGTYSLLGCCDSAGGNPLFRLDYGGVGVAARLQLRGNSGTVLNLAAAFGETAWLDDFIVGVYRSGTGVKEIWVNGVRRATGTTDIGAITLNTTDVGQLSRSGPTQYLNGRMYLGGIYDRALTGREIQDLSVNPWQLFEPEPIQIYWPSAGGGPAEGSGEGDIVLAAVGSGAASEGAGTGTVALGGVGAGAAAAGSGVGDVTLGGVGVGSAAEGAGVGDVVLGGAGAGEATAGEGAGVGDMVLGGAGAGAAAEGAGAGDVVLDGSGAGEPIAVDVPDVTPGIIAKPRQRRTEAQPAQQPAMSRDDVDWSIVARRVEASLQNDRRMRANVQKLMLLMAA